MKTHPLQTIALTALVALLLSACATTKTSPAASGPPDYSPMVSTNKSDGARIIQTRWWKIDDLTGIQARYNADHPNRAIFTVLMIGGYTTITGLDLDIGGEIISLHKTPKATEKFLSHIGEEVSAQDFYVPLKTLQAIVQAGGATLQVHTRSGVADTTMKHTRPFADAYKALSEFLLTVREEKRLAKQD